MTTATITHEREDGILYIYVPKTWGANSKQRAIKYVKSSFKPYSHKKEIDTLSKDFCHIFVKDY